MTTAASSRVVGDLYSDLQPQLVRILSRNLQPPDWVIDEACQTAWSSLLEHRGAVARGGELGWLSTTATRSALHLLRRERAGKPDDDPAVRASLGCLRVPEPGVERQVEVRERLAEIRRLPVRQQRLVMLHGFGYEYDEIAAVTGDTPRTVARQLMRARQRLLRPADER